MLLAIDTSAGTSVAVVHDGRVLARRDEAGTRSHAEAVGVLIAGALADAGIGADALTSVATGVGPGPFTGLRVGIAAARAVAQARGIPLVAVPSADAVALTHVTSVLVVTDARRRESAWSLYDGLDADGIPVRVAGPAHAPAAEVDTVARDAAAGPWTRVDAATIPAGELGIVGERLLRAGRAPDAVEPIYLRAPDATPPGAPKRVSA